MRLYYVYVIRNKDGEFYIGYSYDLNRRLKEHQKEHPGYTFLYCETYLDQALARTRERKLKYYGSAWRALKRRLEA